MSSNMERVAAMPDASLYVNRDGRRADDCVDSHGGGNLIKIPRSLFCSCGVEPDPTAEIVSGCILAAPLLLEI